MNVKSQLPQRWLEPAVAGLAFIAAYFGAFYYFWPLVFLAVAPFALLACRGDRMWPRVLGAGLAGWLMFAAIQYFFALISPKGLAGLAALQGASLMLVALATRWLRQVTRGPLALILPVTWVGGEYLRTLGDLGFTNGSLAWPCWRQLWMIQVCDLAGVSGLGFALAMVNGALADLLLWRLETRTGGGAKPGAWLAMLRLGFTSTSAVWVFIAAYGVWRLREAGATMRPGPIVAVVQPDVPRAPGVLEGFDPELHEEQMFAWSQAALAQHPALIVWPESPAGVPPLNPEFLDPRATNGSKSSPAPLPAWQQEKQQRGRELDARLGGWTESNRVALVLGSPAWLPAPAGQVGDWQVFNAANIYPRKPGKPPEAQFKQRLFPGGEFMPWRGTMLDRTLRWWLDEQAGLAVGRDTSPGTERRVFQLPGRSGESAPPARYVISVCSEILFPDSSAVVMDSGADAKPFDFVVNPGNDGLFLRSRALLVQYHNLAFRAVEARVGIAASCNTGISGFAKPTGELYGEVRNNAGQPWTGRGARELPIIAQLVELREKHNDAEILRSPALYAQLTNTQARIEQLRSGSGVSGHSTQTVYLDSRRTFYSRHGDWLGIGSMWIMLGAATMALTGIGTTRSAKGPASRGGK